MPYRGDYGYGYMGRRGRGDPGFLGNLFRGVVHTVGGALGGLITGGPAGAIGGALGGAFGATKSNIAADAAEQPMGNVPAGYGSIVAAQHQRALEHSSTGQIGGSKIGTPHGPKLHKLLAGGTGPRKHRRMNWANSRALGRAERRIHSAVKHFSKYIKWVHPRKEGHAVPHFGRKKKR